jgi:hypothetical protein
VVPYLGERLMDPNTNPVVRRNLPSVLARIPSQVTVEALVNVPRPKPIRCSTTAP